jgi:hypothetical protein
MMAGVGNGSWNGKDYSSSLTKRHAFEQKEHGWLADEKMCMKSVA